MKQAQDVEKNLYPFWSILGWDWSRKQEFFEGSYEYLNAKNRYKVYIKQPGKEYMTCPAQLGELEYALAEETADSLQLYPNLSDIHLWNIGKVNLTVRAWYMGWYI